MSVVQARSAFARRELVEARQPNVVNYVEQFPIDRDSTQACARALGIQHAVYKGSSMPVLVTPDEVFTSRSPSGDQETHAHDFVQSLAPQNKFVRDRHAIAAAHCKCEGVRYVVRSINEEYA